MKRLLELFATECTDCTASVKGKLKEHYGSIQVRTDRMFAVLMVVQWLGGIAMALHFAPRTWIGAQSSLHPHVMMAVLGGGVLAAMPIAMALFRSGSLATRLVIACSQVMFSGLLIHLSGGRIETHFHVFGSLAFLAAYRDPCVLAPATAIVALDHLIRGVWWPESVFGIATASEWRWLEHAAWVVFEDVFLLIVILQSRREMLELATHTDRLEQREAELERAITVAESANRTKSKFLANMSHEIRTPLNGILGFTEILLRDREGLTESELDENLGTIRRSGQHLLTLINDVLDISKIEADQLRVEAIPCSPHEIISDTVSVLRVGAAEKGIALDYRWESPIPEVIHTDPYRLKQLLLNLVGNAVKFTEQGSVLIVARVEDSGGQTELVLEVRDTGVGIPQAKLDAIFQPFVQADDSVTRQYGGTGLGLAISKNIAQALGGGLTVTSVVNKGSTFVARVATGVLSEEDQRTLTPPPAGADVKNSPATVCDLTGLLVLVVDDGDTNRKLLRMLLERCGAKVRLAENGRVALDMAAGVDFDAILMDMQMPVLDGYTATARLRESGFKGPIIALTAHVLKGDREKCEACGCTGYLSKPFAVDELYQVLTQFTRGRSQDAPPAAPHDARQPIRSLLPTDDAEFREIVEEFLDTLESKLAEMQRAGDEGNLDELAALGHWLRGAGGTVGFGCFTQPAADLEKHALQGDASQSRASIQAISSLKQRVEL